MKIKPRNESKQRLLEKNFWQTNELNLGKRGKWRDLWHTGTERKHSGNSALSWEDYMYLPDSKTALRLGGQNYPKSLLKDNYYRVPVYKALASHW